ncbi:MAG: cell division protein FtsZ [Burkholderiaceae bacterium]
MTLSTALILVAVLVLAALAGHGVWSTRRAQARQAVVEVAQPAAERVEPSMGALPGDATGSAAALVAPSRRAGPRIDALIDAIATLALDAPASGEMLLAHLPASRRAGSKPFHIEGLGAASGEWEPLSLGQRYSELQAGVQLANRSGALNEIEYSEFVQKLQAVADAIGAVPDFPDMLDVVARARELDAFANPHDATLSVLLRANSVAWSVGYIQQCAQHQGFVAGPVAGRLVLPSAEEGAPPVLSLSFDAQAALADDPAQAAVRELTLSLDVAQTPAEAEPFTAWQQAIRALAEDMDASAVDDQGLPLTVQHFVAIRAELDKLYHALEARDMAAGSAAARRLFQ